MDVFRASQGDPLLHQDAAGEAVADITTSSSIFSLIKHLLRISTGTKYPQRAFVSAARSEYSPVGRFTLTDMEWINRPGPYYSYKEIGRAGWNGRMKASVKS